MPLLNYTTSIDVEKTIGEIQKMLGKRGAGAIMTNFEDGIIVGLSFQMPIGDQKMAFKLPCDWRPVLEVMKKDPKVPRRLCDQIQAVRVAWRIIKDWVEAQMALVDTKMVDVQEVFLPYVILRSGKTLSESVQENPQFLLGTSQ